MSWESTSTFLVGKITKPFLPLDKITSLNSIHYRNLYPGDEVYIFETKNDKWARGYALTKPFPNDFTITSVNLDDLPGVNINIVIFPLKFVHITKSIPFEIIKVHKEFNNIIDNGDTVPSLEQSEHEYKSALNGVVDNHQPSNNNSLTNGKLISKSIIPIPSLPNKKFDIGDNLHDEVKHALELLTYHIFALYSIGEFRLYHKLSGIYHNLNETRIKLLNDLLTKSETQTAKETVTFLLDRIPKKLGSRSARLNAFSYDLDNEDTDASGYKALLARDPFTGQLLSHENSIPSIVALEQELGSLESNFPINAKGKSYYTLVPPLNKKLIAEPPSHILVDFKSVSGSSAYQPPGFVGMTAYLYIRNSKKRLTEAFAVHTNSVDELVQVEKISAALFRNIPHSEVENSRIYLAAVLTEEVEFKSMSTHIRRVKKGVAAGATDITRVFSGTKGSLASGESHQFSIKLFGSYISTKKGPSDNSGWGELVDRIISGSDLGIAVNPRAEKLTVTLKEFKHQFASGGNQITSLSATPISRIRPIFFDPLAENYERLYLSLGKVVPLNGINKDDLLTFEITTPNNELITFAKASNQQEKRSWQFISVFANESIGEIVKINGVSLKNPSKKKGPKEDFIQLSLYINGILGGEGKLLYKSGNRLVEFNKRKAHTVEIMSLNYKLSMASVEIGTEYVGKIYNSDISIENIFQFERFFSTQLQEELSLSLVQFCKLDISQLVKYFPELLSSLYGIINYIKQDGYSSDYDELLDNTFKAIIHLLDTIFGKQEQYLYLVDNFLHKYPSLPRIGVYLINKISHIISNAETNWNVTSRSLCRIVSILLKLALNSIDSIDEYTKSLNQLFTSATIFLALDSTTLVNDQVLIMEVIDYVLSYKANINEEIIFGYIAKFIDSIGTRGLGLNEEGHAQIKDHKIIINKMLLVHRLFNSFLIHNSATAKTLTSKAIEWSLEVLLGATDIDASRLALTVFNAACTQLYSSANASANTNSLDTSAYSLTLLLPSIARTIVKYNKFTRGNEFFKPKRTFTRLFPSEFPFKESSNDPIVNDESLVEILVELASVFVFIGRIAKANRIEIKDSDLTSENIVTILTAIKLIRQGGFFPERKWLSLYAIFIEGNVTILELIHPLLIRQYIPPIEKSDNFDRTIWGVYFKNLLKLAVLQPVSIEHLTDIPKKATGQITGTVRDRISLLLNEAWDALAWDSTNEDIVRFNLKKFGGYQVEYIANEYGIIPDLMLFALQKNKACQVVSVKILWSLLISEYLVNDGSIDIIEREAFIGLHDIYTRNGYKPTPFEQTSLINRLKATIRIDREDEAFNVIYNFILNLSGFLEVLNDLVKVPIGPEFDDERTFHKLNINSYLKKPEIFNSFINSMYEENLSKEDYIQAALSLELLASTYAWDHHTILSASIKPKFPEQSAFERKDALYKMIAGNFIKGNSLERAADIYNELLDAYHENTFDLKSLSFAHGKLSKLYLDLESSDKLMSSYFRVAFIGSGFPVDIRGKEQIYEGLPFEHITSIHERLLKLYPGARIITNDEEAQKLEERIPTGRYLHVTTIEPINEISDKLFNQSIGARKYARNKDLRFFSTMRKLPGYTSAYDLWTEETTYETYLSFPTLMNRSDIKSTKTVKLSPLENAIRTIINKNNDLIQLESSINQAIKEKLNYDSYFNDLSRQLTGTVDSPVNGGIGQYRKFFEQGNDYQVESVRLLRNVFDDLALIINRCLILHGKLVPSTMKLSHEALIDLFKKNFKEEIDSLGIIPESVHPTISTTFGSQSNSSRSVSTASTNGSGSGSGSGSMLIMNPKFNINGYSNGLTFPSSNGSKMHRSTSSASSSASDFSYDKHSDQARMSTATKRNALNWRRQ
ncbi:dedicator of cytokinesis protein 4 CRK binding protein [Scheffersomyces amazonensis]|uniref:dedicator of cytokinesis protein 4 CRK binding protein n=1 Tax=Scheffersomyces amazonensis TaxID=1078765 RepID=UPI00315C9550